MARSASVPIEIDRNGKTYKGAYTIDATGDLITVIYAGKSKVTQLGGFASAPESLARIILGELAAGLS